MIIVLFHVLYLFGKYVYENFHPRKEKTDDNTMTNQLLNVSEADYADFNEREHDADNMKINVKFFPPVYVQRYNAVQKVIASDPYIGKIHKVIDFGCAELSFAIHLKNTNGIREIYCIDVDRPLLDKFQSKVAPLHCDYLSLRTDPLTIHVCEGSIAHTDNKLANTDAVICIELIEHLYPDDLEAFPYSVFGFIKPQVAIVTTPNADFNVLFNLGTGFRHDDHKFEWTRKQFQDWANNIILRYPEYEVSFHGIGTGPGGTEHLGTCSQMAVFHRLVESQSERSQGIDGLLKTVVSHEYPYRPDNRSDEEKILDEAVYYIRLFSARHEEMYEEIPLKTLMFSVEKFRISVEILKSILEEANWAIAERENGPVVLIPPRSMFSSDSDVDIDDFLDNDYRHRDGDDDWDNLELGNPSSGYYFDSYVERGTANHGEEENWDVEDPDDAQHSSNSNLNSQNLPNSELLVSENADRTSDSQWTMEDLINEDPLIDGSQTQPAVTVNSFGIETELPSNSLSIELDCTDIDYLNISNDTLDSSEHRLSSPFPVPDLSETSQSLGTESCQSFSVNRNPNLFNKCYKRPLESGETDAGICVEDGTNLKLDTESCSNPVFSSKRPKKSKYDSTIDNEEPNIEPQMTEDKSENCSLVADVLLPSNDYPKLISTNSQSPSLESTAIDDVDCHSVRNETSSISTVEAAVLISAEPSLSMEDLSLNAQGSVRNEDFIDKERESLITQDHASSLFFSNKSTSEIGDYHDPCSTYLQTSCIRDNSLLTGNEASYLSVGDFSSPTNENYKNLDVSVDSIDSNYQKCQTELIDTRIMISERIKSQDSMSFKSISDCSLDLRPKFTSSPQILTNNQRTHSDDEGQLLRNYKSLVVETDQSTTSNDKIQTEASVENIALSTSQLSLQSNSDISLSAATSTGSSNMDKWYAAETNPMYKQDLVVLKGGNDTADNPNEDTTSDSDATVSSSDRGKESTEHTDRRSKKSDRSNKYKLNEDVVDESETVTFISDNCTKDKIGDELSCGSFKQNFANNFSQDLKKEDNFHVEKNGVELIPNENMIGLQNDSENTNDIPTSSNAVNTFVDQENLTSDIYKVTKTLGESTKKMLEKVDATRQKLESTLETTKKIAHTVPQEDEIKTHKGFPEQVYVSNVSASFMPTVKKINTEHDHEKRSTDLRLSGFSNEIKKTDFPTLDILNTHVSERRQLQSTLSTCTVTSNNEVSTSYNVTKSGKEKNESKSEFDLTRGSDNVDSQLFSPESLDTPPNSWSPEIMDSGYPNSASVQDITPEYELSSIANDRISDSDSASVAEELPVPGFYENVEVENGDLANNNRDDEGNNVIAFEANDLDDLQPLIDVLENDMENENDIYVLQNGFPMWLLRILEMANPIDLEGRVAAQAQLYPAALDQAGGDAPNVNADNDEGFDSSSSDDDSDIGADEADDDSDIEDDEADDVTSISSDETEDPSARNLRRDWRAGGDP